MMNSPMNNKPMRFWLAAFAVSSLAACNDNDNDNDAVVTAPQNTPAKLDFTAQVAAEAKTSNDDVEPKDIDAIVLATADDAEPITIN